MFYRLVLPLLSFVFAFSPAAVLAETPSYTITLEQHRFVPAELKIPAGQKVKLIVVNKDPSAEEFESYDLKREKIVAGGGTISVFVGPLKPGKYSYFGEFNPKTAQGVIIAE